MSKPGGFLDRLSDVVTVALHPEIVDELELAEAEVTHAALKAEARQRAEDARERAARQVATPPAKQADPRPVPVVQDRPRRQVRRKAAPPKQVAAPSPKPAPVPAKAPEPVKVRPRRRESSMVDDNGMVDMDALLAAHAKAEDGRKADEARQETADVRRELARVTSELADVRHELATAPPVPVTAPRPRKEPKEGKPGPTPKLMRFPPAVMARLEALALAYGLDQTSVVRLAVTELHKAAVKAGTVAALPA